MDLTVRWLKNHQLSVRYRNGRQSWSRHEGPKGWVTLPEAAAALGTYPEMIRRMVESGALKARHRVMDTPWTRRPPRFVAMRNVLKLRRLWKGAPPTTRTLQGTK